VEPTKFPPPPPPYRDGGVVVVSGGGREKWWCYVVVEMEQSCGCIGACERGKDGGSGGGKTARALHDQGAT
jgi:hypothetical protein